MKQLFPLLLLLLSPVFSYSQDCDDYSTHTAIGLSYILPGSVSAEGAYFTKVGLTAGVGVAYSVPAKTIVKSGANEYSTRSNMLDLFAYVGYRVFKIDYTVSAFLNAGYIMGDVNEPQPFFSTKILFPAGQKAFSVEPFYVVNRGFSGRATVYFKL
ncbi:MAG: hypothetical protein ABI675_28450 [Chitinophagaceae bacterium]